MPQISSGSVRGRNDSELPLMVLHHKDMRKMWRIELRELIKSTRVSFIAIIIFITMSVALFLGFTWASEGITASVDSYYTKGNFQDLIIQFSSPCNEESIQSLKNIDGIDYAEGYVELYKYLAYDGNYYKVRFTTLTTGADVPMNVNGRLPQKPDEIAIEGNWAETHGVNIGDTLSFSDTVSNTKETYNLLKENQFTVTGTLDNAVYLSRVTDTYGLCPEDYIPVSCLLYIDESAINKDLLPGYTNAVLRSDLLRAFSYFSDDYKDAVYDLKTAVGNQYKGCDIYVRTSYDNISTVNLRMVKNIFEKLRYSMAGLFVIVGLLVCYFSISRIVYDNTVFIGTKKALGFSDFQILRPFVLYAVIVVLIGMVLGSLAARFIMAPALIMVLRDIYVFDETICVFGWPMFTGFFFFELAIQIVTVFLAGRSLLKRNALSLIKDEKVTAVESHRYEKTGIWKRMPLLSKTIINNIFNEKKRVISTLISITGCTTLLVSAYTMNNHIFDSFKRQYEQIFNYDTILFFDPDADPEDIKGVLSEKGISFAEVSREYMNLDTPQGNEAAANLIVTDDHGFSGIFHLTDTEDRTLDLSDGIYVSCSYGEEYELSQGDALSFTDMNQKKHSVPIHGFFQYYLITNIITVMDSRSYEQEFGRDYRPNALLFSRSGFEMNELNAELCSKDGFIYLQDDYQSNKIAFDSFTSVFIAVTVIYSLLALALALLVFMNLITLFIAEKKKELTVLMINGYSSKNARKYISYDTVVLTVTGILLGVFIGNAMGNISIAAFMSETIYFVTGYDIKACLIGVIGTGIIAFLITYFSLKQIDRFDLHTI